MPNFYGEQAPSEMARRGKDLFCQGALGLAPVVLGNSAGDPGFRSRVHVGVFVALDRFERVARELGLLIEGDGIWLSPKAR